MTRAIRAAQRLPLLFLLLAAAGCAGNGLGGALGNILGGLGGIGGNGQMTGEVQQVDTQRQQLWIVDQSGQQQGFDYDSRTVVVYQQQQYPVTSLDRGDVVSVTAQQEQNGGLYASEIDVQQTVQSRTGTTGTGTGQLQQFSGRVGQINQNAGWFQLQTSYGTYTVTLPYNPSSATLDTFRRLRSGDTVQIEGQVLTQDRIELSRFI